MIKNALKAAIIFSFAISISCNQNQSNEQVQQSQKEETSQTSTSIKEEPIQKKSNANFIIISEIHEPMVKSPGNPDAGHKNWYSIYVENFNDKDENIWSDMSAEAKSKPHDLNGFTIVFFFNNKTNTPILNNSLKWAEKYDKYCVGGYWYYPSGKQEMKRYPMK